MSDHGNSIGSPPPEKVTPASERDAPITFQQNMAALNQLGTTIDLRLNEIAVLRNRLDRYRAAMENVCDELEEDFDTVDGGDGQPAPNKAMRLASELREAIYGSGGF